jgi:hypothetical protein
MTILLRPMKGLSQSQMTERFSFALRVNVEHQLRDIDTTVCHPRLALVISAEHTIEIRQVPISNMAYRDTRPQRVPVKPTFPEDSW